MEVEPSVLLAETEELGLLECVTQEIQRGVTLNEDKVLPELHFTGDEDPTGEI